jgi:disulfide oxidoreductase YuzD
MTSIEWLIQELYTEMNMCGYGRVLDEIFEEAKEMHKQEIIEAIEDGRYEFGYEYYNDTFVSKGSDTLKDYHIVDTNEMIKRGTLKKRMDKDAWFIVFQSNAYNEDDMAYDLLKSQEIDIDMYDVYKDGDEVTFEVVDKKWAKITPFLYPFETKSSQQEISDEETKLHWKTSLVIHTPEISDEEIEDASLNIEHYNLDMIVIERIMWRKGAKWYREQLKQKK